MRILFSSAVAAGLLLLPVSACAQDASAWAGFNIGLQASRADGDQLYLPSSDYTISGNGLGIFAGYMMANGPWAYGAELSYASTDYIESEPDGSAEYPEYVFTHTLDIKARVGYAVDRALVYGTIGYGTSEWEDGAPSTASDANGVIFGLGVDYLVSDKMFVGAEVLRRDMDSDIGFVADVNTFTLRAGMKF
jgi:outer membrane immunogenic protein